MSSEKIQRMKNYCRQNVIPWLVPMNIGAKNPESHKSTPYPNWLLIVLSLLFLLVYLWGMSFYVANQQFNSPDESANYYFLQEFVKSGQVAVEQNDIVTDALHPRSILLWQNKLVPISFPGLIYILAPFYLLAGLWGVFVFYAILFIFLMYLLGRWLKRESLPPVLWFLVAVQPALWYYLFHPLFNNVLSLLLAFSGMFLLSEPKKWAKNIGIFILILALWVRPFDVVYILPILFVGSFYYAVAWRRRLTYFIALSVGAGLLFGMSNYLIYGSPFLCGYNLPSSVDSVISPSVISLTARAKLLFHNVLYFIVQLFWPFFYFALLGFLAFILNWKNHKKSTYLFLFSLIFSGGALVLFYGLSDLNDHVVPGSVTIGGAFARYWLPIYLLFLPFVALFYEALKNAQKKYLANLMLLILCLFSFYGVLWQHDDSLWAERKNLIAGIADRQAVSQVLSKNSILVIDRDDKYFFPHYRVLHLSTFTDSYALSAIHDLLLSGEPVFYYGFTFKNKEFNRINAEHLQFFHLRLKAFDLSARKSLYQFELYE